jgi:glycosyltransferase involved in cell wall biosynthesis
VFDGQVSDSDALFATNWISAYTVRSLGNTARKFYFVQDLEYLFHAEGSLEEFAKETYRWDFEGITLGNWIAGVLRSQYGMRCSPFGFSYDKGTYTRSNTRSSKPKKRVLFYARPNTERRGFELGILALSLVARKMPEVECVLVGFPPREMKFPFSAVLPGILKPVALAALYRECDVALVLSHTNLSMLPLELMASGCAVVSNRGPNVEWLLNDDLIALARPTPQCLAQSVLALLEDENLRRAKVTAGLAFAEQTDWAFEIKKIETALYEALDIRSAVAAL